MDQVLLPRIHAHPLTVPMLSHCPWNRYRGTGWHMIRQHMDDMPAEEVGRNPTLRQLADIRANVDSLSPECQLVQEMLSHLRADYEREEHVEGTKPGWHAVFEEQVSRLQTRVVHADLTRRIDQVEDFAQARLREIDRMAHATADLREERRRIGRILSVDVPRWRSDAAQAAPPERTGPAHELAQASRRIRMETQAAIVTLPVQGIAPTQDAAARGGLVPVPGKTPPAAAGAASKPRSRPSRARLETSDPPPTETPEQRQVRVARAALHSAKERFREIDTQGLAQVTMGEERSATDRTSGRRFEMFEITYGGTIPGFVAVLHGDPHRVMVKLDPWNDYRWLRLDSDTSARDFAQVLSALHANRQPKELQLSNAQFSAQRTRAIFDGIPHLAIRESGDQDGDHVRFSIRYRSVDGQVTAPRNRNGVVILEMGHARRRYYHVPTERECRGFVERAAAQFLSRPDAGLATLGSEKMDAIRRINRRIDAIAAIRKPLSLPGVQNLGAQLSDAKVRPLIPQLYALANEIPDTDGNRMKGIMREVRSIDGRLRDPLERILEKAPPAYREKYRKETGHELEIPSD